jgi:hypothetical protein
MAMVLCGTDMMLRALEARTLYNTRVLMDFQQVYIAAAWWEMPADGAEGGGRGRPPSKGDLI